MIHMRMLKYAYCNSVTTPFVGIYVLDSGNFYYLPLDYGVLPHRELTSQVFAFHAV